MVVPLNCFIGVINMNFKQLEAFLKVADLQSFTKAAKQLYMSQPAISFQIKALEDDLQVVLFQRGDKKISLTEAGRLLYPEASQMLRHYHKLKAGLEDLKELKTGHMVVGASTIPGEYILPLFIGGFHKEYPGIKINLRVAGSGDVARWVRDKEIDIGITGTPVVGDDIDCQPWVADRLVAIVSSNFGCFSSNGRNSLQNDCSPNETREVIEIGIEDFLKLPLLLREPGSGTRKTFEFKLAEKGFVLEQCQVIMELGSTRAVITAVQAGLGVSVVSGYAAREALELGKVKEVVIKGLDPTRFLYVVRHNDMVGAFAAEAFNNFIKDESKIVSFLG